MLCNICKIDKSDSEFYTSNKHTCKECVKLRTKKNRMEREDYYKEYDRNRPNHKERIDSNRERNHNLKINDPDKYKEQNRKRGLNWKMNHEKQVKANYAVSNAIRDGKLQKLSTCENCGDSYKVQAHHESYEEVDWLNVVWLCDQCHKERHKVLNNCRREGSTPAPINIPFAPIGLIS